MNLRILIVLISFSSTAALAAPTLRSRTAQECYAEVKQSQTQEGHDLGIIHCLKMDGPYMPYQDCRTLAELVRISEYRSQAMEICD